MSNNTKKIKLISNNKPSNEFAEESEKIIMKIKKLSNESRI